MHYTSLVKGRVGLSKTTTVVINIQGYIQVDSKDLYLKVRKLASAIREGGKKSHPKMDLEAPKVKRSLIEPRANAEMENVVPICLQTNRADLLGLVESIGSAQGVGPPLNNRKRNSRFEFHLIQLLDTLGGKGCLSFENGGSNSQMLK